MNTAINPKGPRVPSATNSPAAWTQAYFGVSVGQKIIVGLTGLLLVGFLVFHMIGNLKVLPSFEPASEEATAQATEKAKEKFPTDVKAQATYVSETARAFDAREHINKYAYFLKYDLGALIWIARGGLLLLFVAHLSLALWLKWKSNAARPIGYQKQVAAQASVASKTMLWTGVVTLAFVAFHLAHYTLGWAHDAETPSGKANYMTLHDPEGRHDVYSMVVAGFSTPWISALYLVCQILLFIHLSHGIPSSLVTLGLVGKRFAGAAKALGYAVAGTILAGNVLIVAGVWMGFAKSVL